MHAEICEDVWVPMPPSGEAALAGATVLANLSASNITIGKAETRRLLCRSQSARCLAAYLYAAAGAGESTTDLAWDGQASVFENGHTLAETERFPADHAAAIADIDLDLLRAGTAADGLVRHQPPAPYAAVPDCRRSSWTRPAAMSASAAAWNVFRSSRPTASGWSRIAMRRTTSRCPALTQRLRATGIKRVVIGVSGGLDSTQALIVCAQAFDLLGLPRYDIFAYTMPGFATVRSDETQRRGI